MPSSSSHRGNTSPAGEQIEISTDLELFFNLNTDMMCIIGFDGYFKHINPAFEAVLGYPHTEILNYAILELVHPQDLPTAINVFDQIARGIAFQKFELRFQCANGGYQTLSWNARSSLQRRLIYAVARDISAESYMAQQQRDRERRWQTIVDSVMDGMIMITEDGIIESFNLGAEKIFGYNAKEVLGQNISLLMPQPHRDLHDQYIRQYLHTGIKKIIGVGREVDGMRKDGTIFPISLAVTEVKLESQRLFLGMVRDLTEQVKQEAIKDSLLAREAHQLGRVEMASGILHDLGNVMTGITTQATAIKTSLESSTVIRRLTQICEFFHAHSSQLSQIFDANKSSALLNYLDGIADLHKREHHTLHSGLQKMLACCSHSHDLIMAHRSYAGTSGNMSIREISLRKLFFDVQMMMSDAVTKRNGVIITRCSENLPHIKLDQSKLIQVLLNLIKNSIEAYEQRVDRQQLEITLSAQQITSGECVIQVSDNGLGIAPHQNNDIFIDGYSTKKRGSGLGLGMSRRVIETLGGSLTLKSDGPNTGTTAHIQLPKEIFVDVSSAER